MNETKLNLFTWIKKYPKKIMLSFFIILILTLLISFITFSLSNNTKKFYFDKEGDTPTYLTNKVLSKNREFNEYFDEINFKLKKVTLNIEDDSDYDKTPYRNGNFEFEIDYKLKSFYQNSTVDVRWILKTKHTEVQSNTRNVSFSNNKATTSMDYFDEIPNKYFLIFNTKSPIAYFEIKITKPSNLGDDKIETLYYMVDINDSKGYTVAKK